MNAELDKQLTELIAVSKENAKLEEEYRWRRWRARLLEAWANDSRALMTALLEDGPDE